MAPVPERGHRETTSEGGCPMATYTREDVLAWRGHDMIGSDGDKIGSIDDIYLDRETEQPEWAVVTTGLFGTKRTFVPLADAQSGDDGVRVPFDKATVKDAPRIDPDGALSSAEERELYRNYGPEDADYDEGSGLRDAGTRTDVDADAGVDTGERGGPGRDVSGPNTD